MSKQNRCFIRAFLAYSAALAGYLYVCHAAEPQVAVWGWADLVQRVPGPVASLGVKQIDIGQEHALALMHDGTVTPWGYNDYNEIAISSDAAQAMAAGGGVNSVAAGWYQSVVLLNNGSLATWGGNYQIPPGFDDIVQIDSGDSFFVVLCANGTVSAFGSPFCQQTQVPASLQGHVQQITCGQDHVTVLTKEGSVTGWGCNQDSALGVPPALSIPGANVTKVVAGTFHNLALLQSGRVVCWGRNTDGQCNVPDAALNNVIDIAAGNQHSVALLRDGTIIAWGANTANQLNVPTAKSTYCNIVAGYNVSAAYTGNCTFQPIALPPGAVTAFGSNSNSQLKVPSQASSGIVQLSAGALHSLALKYDGTLTGWGSNSFAQAAVPPGATSNVIAMSAGDQHSLAVLQGGTVVAWGNNAAGQCNVPADLPPVTAVAGGANISIALTASGSLIGWGTDQAGQLAFPASTNNNVLTISASSTEVMAVLSDGSAIGWGKTLSGLLEASPYTHSSVAAVAAGTEHGLVLLDSGMILFFGNDRATNVSNIPAAVQGNAIAICINEHHAAAVTRDGKIHAWGQNLKGEVGPIPAEALANKYRLVACGLEFTLGLSAGQTPIPLSPSTPPGGSLQGLTGGQSKPLSAGAIAGIAVSVGCVGVLGVLAAYMMWRKGQQQQLQPQASMRTSDKGGHEVTVHVDFQPPDAAIMKGAMEIPGLVKGELFTRATAQSYYWNPAEPTALQSLQPIESGVNDTSLDRLASGGQPGPVIQLTKEQLQQQIQLMKHGLLGRGATALVFKCMWPSRFGPNALLAAKVLKDGFELDMVTLQSFSYEANVLASFNPPHPNVVRLYGYCLEPPTVCLIMELLPKTLNDVLYKKPQTPAISTHIGAHMAAVKGNSVMATLHGLALPAHHDMEERSSSRDTLPTPPTTTGQSAALASSSTEHCASTQHSNEGSSGTDAPHKRLTLLEVLHISVDIAAGLKYLHATPMTPELAELAEETGLESVDELPSVSTNTTSMTSSNSVNGPRTTKTSKVVHRDLKPANILINTKGRAKISDFGLARPQVRTTLMTDHIGAGTMPYMGPELLVGSRMGAAAVPATNKVDIYSTAMIMWEMLSGKIPWARMNETTMLASVLGGRRPELPGPEDGEPDDDDDTEQEEQLDTQGEPKRVLARPAALHALPEFNAIIRACWQQREHRRPTAAALHGMLVALMQKYGEQP